MVAATIAIVILIAALIYLLIGFVFAIWFAVRGVQQLDEEAAHAPFIFRLLIIPGSILLWIFLLKKNRGGKKL